MKTPEQLKGAIRNMAANNHLRAQEVLQMFLFERILERLASSPYRDNFILKGGLLISSMIGISERTTMDMDTTVRGIPMEEEQIVAIVQKILGIDVGDGIEFVFQKIEPIREDDAYNNFRVHLEAIYGKIHAPMKIDITTGDKITPAAVEYEYRFLFEEKTVPVMAYTLETILAEKYETIIRRNIGTTRARDFYDLHTLFQVRRDAVRVPVLKEAVIHTASKRGSLDDLQDWKEIVQDIRSEVALQQLWTNYIQDNRFASGLTFSEVVDTVETIGSLLGIGAAE
jgi:predicted nucleotidyltransferase component of viral defense system